MQQYINMSCFYYAYFPAMLLIVLISARPTRISLDSRESTKATPYLTDKEGNGCCKCREKRR